MEDQPSRLGDHGRYPAKQMQYRLQHLFIFVTIIAVGTFSIDQYTSRTVAVDFSTATDLTKSTTSATPPDNSDYAVNFTIRSVPYSYNGVGYGNFGHNRLLSTKLTKSNISQLEGRTVMVKFRHRPLPWLPETRVSDELDKHFLPVLIFPNIEEERQASRFRR